MTTLLAFTDTKKMFAEYLNYKGPLSFEEWMKLNKDQKVAALFVQFYSEITLAWTKVNQFDFIEGEDGVSTMNQYLEKNIARIESDPKRFTPAYIYRVAYNCLYCICHDRKCDKDRYENETSAVIVKDGEEFNLFDTVADRKGTPEDMLNKRQFENEFWSVIRGLGDKAEKVLRYLSSGDVKDLKKLNPRAKQYKFDPLRDVDVSLEEAELIIAQLRQKFMNLPISSNCGKYLAGFASIA